MSESDPNPAPSAPRVRRPRAATPAPEAATSTPEAASTPEAVTPPPPAPETAAPAPTAPAPTAPAFTPPTTDLPVAGPATPAPQAPPKQRTNPGPLVAALAIGALVGGASGAGVAAWAVASSIPAQEETASGPQTINVNNPDDVNVVNAVATKAGPSVVTISVSAQTAAGTGSGVILSDDGYVLTNNHVVTLDGASNDGKIEVTTADGRIFQAKVVGTDPIVDLAVIKLVEASGLTPIEFGDDDALDVGDRVVAIGAPLGLSNTVTDGIVSALDRSIQVASSAVPDGDSQDDDGNSGQGPFNFDLPGQQQPAGGGAISLPVIQTDAAINPGNSGGALVNGAGELVGINVAIANAGGSGGEAGSIGVGFAIPVSLAQRVAKDLIDSGSATHGLLGATVQDATSADGSIVGAVVKTVTDDGAAHAVGLEPGDIVTELGGTPITGSIDLTAQVRSFAAGAETELVFVRDGEKQTVSVTLGELP